MNETAIAHSARVRVSERTGWRRWAIFATSMVGFLGMTIGMTVLFSLMSEKFTFPIHDVGWVAYLVVFGSALVSSVTIMTPAPVGLSLMLSAAMLWNPLLVGLAAGLGSSVGRSAVTGWAESAANWSCEKASPARSTENSASPR